MEGEGVAALGRALCQLGHGVTVAMPRSEAFEEHGVMVARRLTPLTLPNGQTATVYDGQLPSSVRLVLLEPGKSRDQSAPPSGQDDPIQRLGIFCQGAAAFAEQRATQGSPFDVVHAHGWQAAATCALSALPSVVTFYDPAARGELPAEALQYFGVPDSRRGAFEHGTAMSLLQGGMLSAKLVATTSSHLAQQALQVDFAGAMAAKLAQAGTEILGVGPGLDYAVYNPATDSAITTRYDAESSTRKSACKAALCHELELSLDAELPLVIFAQPLGSASGSDLMASSALALCKSPLQLVIAGTGDAAGKKALAAAKLSRLPNYRYLDRFSPELERRLLAAADIAVCPNREPGLGLVVKAAQRYGAIPVALSTPLSQDAIVDCPPELSSGTGFLFDEVSADSLRAGVERAVAAFGEPARFAALRRRIMHLDLGGDRTARRYAQLYKVITSDTHPLDN